MIVGIGAGKMAQAGVGLLVTPEPTITKIGGAALVVGAVGINYGAAVATDEIKNNVYDAWDIK